MPARPRPAHRPSTRRQRRLTTAATLVLAAAAVTLAPTASAAPVTGAGTSLTFSGTGGDYISQDRAWAYDPTDAAFTASASTDHRSVALHVEGATWWDVNLVAPVGQTLTAGRTYVATRWPFQSPTSGGFDLSGDGRGCNTSTSTFTVRRAVFGPHGYVKSFAATFEQHCEGGASFASGRVVLENPPAPPTLAATVAITGAVVNASGSRVALTGTLTCTKPGQVTVSGRLTQRVSDVAFARAPFTTALLACGPTPRTWRAAANAQGNVPFHAGDADSVRRWSGTDTFYGIAVSGSSTGVVTITNG